MDKNDHTFSIMRFLPGEIWINQGDTIEWTARSGEIHTVTYLPNGMPPAFDPFDPMQGAPHGGSHFSSASTYYNSGIMGTLSTALPIPIAKTYKLTFDITGNFTFDCLVHPGMMMTVHVRSKGTSYPHSQSYYDHQAEQTAEDLFEQGQDLQEQAQDKANNHYVVAGIGNMDVDVMRFINSTITIHVGDTVTFANLSMGPHTVTFGPEIVGNNNPYGTPSNFTGGQLSSGIFFGTFQVKFNKVGTFSYICILHDYLGMSGKVIVLARGQDD